MAEQIYTEHPELYDAIQSEWPYDRDVSFVLAAMERHGVDGTHLLELGCGTGEHTRRFVDEGFEVTAIDKYDGMLDRAREKCDASFHHLALPSLPANGTYDTIVALRGVINHLAPDELEPSLRAIADRLADDGLLVFDNSSLPPEGNHPALDVDDTEYGQYGRIAQLSPRSDDRLDWQSILVVPEDDGILVNSRPMTPFADDTIASKLRDCGLTADTHDGFDADDRRTVFVTTS